MPDAQAGVTLVSFAEGQRFVRSQRVLESLVGSHGISRITSFNAASLSQDPLFQQHAAAFAMLKNWSRRVREKRPFCDAFKPLALLRGLLDNDGRWVLWTDSSQWNRPRLTHSVLDATAALEARHIDGAWGTLHCRITGVGARGKTHPRNDWLPAVRKARNYALVSSEALNTYVPKDQHARVLASEHVLATHLLVRSTPAARTIAKKWLEMATEHPSAFCNANQDQAALALLHHNERLPRIDLCGPFPNGTGGPAESIGQFMRTPAQKQLRVFIHALAARAFEVHAPS